MSGSRAARVFLMRHGETEWSRSGRHTGITDIPLTPTGEEQARSIGQILEGHRFELVLSSPRERATRTAQLAGFGNSVQLDENLAEWDYGAYEGMTTPEIAQQLGHPWYLWDDGVPAGNTPGETSEDVRRRAQSVIARILPVLDTGGDVLLVAHGHSLRAFAAAWLGLPPTAGGRFTLATGTVSELGFDHDRPVIARWNCAP
jgi:probable phosphoglycerate mutase